MNFQRPSRTKTVASALVGLALAAALGLSSCASPILSSATGITISGGNVSLYDGMTKQLSAAVLPSSASQTVSWTSSDTSVATVSSSGVVTAVAPGAVTITATAANGIYSTTTMASWSPNDGYGYVQFKAADPAFYDYIWTKSFTGEQSWPSSTTITLSLEKVSGCTTQGYGFRFCAADSNNYYELLIAADGFYLIGKEVAGVWTTLSGTALAPWVANSDLATVVGVPNTVSVSQPSAGNFHVIFNAGTSPVDFADSSLSAGWIYFLASTGSSTNENFPTDPEDIRFKITSPVTYP
ncbi:MAG TPA: Ig-like domain-containing protein [Rectinemataceae bacterium]|nr:Ig-like domain-containing protein [Rectinemataceae bacterium]